jgi:hypothetical protein
LYIIDNKLNRRKYLIYAIPKYGMFNKNGILSKKWGEKSPRFLPRLKTDYSGEKLMA